MSMIRNKLVLFGLFLSFAVFAPLFFASSASAIDIPDQGNMLSNTVLLDSGAMGTGQAGINNIQAFLNSKGGYIAGYKSMFDCRAKLDDGSVFLGQASRDAYIAIGAPCGQADASTATIIYYASQVYGINPRVIISTLQKETSLVTAASRNDNLINKAMGYNCPDDGGCTATAGSNFIYQIDGGAWALRFRFERLNGNTSYWPSSSSTACTYSTRYFSPSLYPRQTVDFSDGGDGGGPSVQFGSVYMANAATASLYCYTPHMFNNWSGCPNNQFASGLPIVGNRGACYRGSYNFYGSFAAWFGSSTVLTELLDRYTYLASSSRPLGNPVDSGFCINSAHDACWQEFQYGYLVYSRNSGAWESYGSIRTRWAQMNYQNSSLGYPTGPVVCGIKDGGCYQLYQNGYIVGTDPTGYWESMGSIRAKWGSLSFENGTMGYPTGPIYQTSSNGYYQAYQNGYIVGTNATGFWESRGAIRDRWGATGFETGRLGYPINTPDCSLANSGCKQDFQGGTIYWTAGTGAWHTMGAINGRYSNLGTVTSSLGYPVRGEVCGTIKDGGCFQQYQNGYIVGTGATGWWESRGVIRERWAAIGYENGRLGYPTGPLDCTQPSSGCKQSYQGGSIYWTSGTGAWQTMGSINGRYAALGANSGSLGYPVAAEACGSIKNNGCFQQYQNGYIVGTGATGWWESRGGIRTRWAALGYENGSMGYPVGGINQTSTNGSFQQYQGGFIVGTADTGFWESSGSIREQWAKLGYETGSLGYPTGAVTCNGATCSQTYQHGTIYKNQTTTWYTL